MSFYFNCIATTVKAWTDGVFPEPPVVVTKASAATEEAATSSPFHPSIVVPASSSGTVGDLKKAFLSAFEKTFAWAVGSLHAENDHTWPITVLNSKFSALSDSDKIGAIGLLPGETLYIVCLERLKKFPIRSFGQVGTKRKRDGAEGSSSTEQKAVTKVVKKPVKNATAEKAKVEKPKVAQKKKTPKKAAPVVSDSESSSDESSDSDDSDSSDSESDSPPEPQKKHTKKR